MSGAMILLEKKKIPKELGEIELTKKVFYDEGNETLKAMIQKDQFI
jgi:hypothetical protein